MKSFVRISIMIMVLFLGSGCVLAQDSLQFANMGDYRLENGQVIRNCRVAYRTFGVLNQDKSNAVLFPTWLVGTTKDLIDLGLIGPGKLADSSKYFIIAVDAFGNGVSSSPSNSRRQPNQAFPQFSIRDMVSAQHLLLTRDFHVNRLHGIIGISMGAMAAYQWMVSYPDFAERVVAISGSPRLTSYDLLLWQAELGAINTGAKKPEGKSSGMKTLAAIHNLHLRTPDYMTANVKPEAFSRFMGEAEKGIEKFNAYNWTSQLKAIIHQDIYRSFGEEIESAVKIVKAKTLIVWAKQDLTVNSAPAQKLAEQLHADTFELPGDCGHLSFLCESDKLRDVVNNFMN